MRSVCAAAGVDGEEEAGGESEYPDDVLAGAFVSLLGGGREAADAREQVPGSFLFVYTLAVRPGVNWTGYATVRSLYLPSPDAY